MMTSSKYRFLIVLLSLAGAVAAVGSVSAQQPPAGAKPAQAAPAAPAAPLPMPPKGSLIVTVDPPTIERDATAFQTIRAQRDRMVASLQSEVQKAERELRTADEDLNKQRAILSPEAYTQKRRDLDKRFADAQQSVQNRGRDIEQATGDAYNKVVAQMRDIIADVVREYDYKVVVARPQLIASQMSIDMSGEIVTRLNKKVPTATIVVPK